MTCLSNSTWDLWSMSMISFLRPSCHPPPFQTKGGFGGRKGGKLLDTRTARLVVDIGEL